jgi:VWFA-related protein
VIGDIVLEANVLSVKPIREVVFYVDGRPVGMVTAAPYQLRMSLGDENRVHTFQVIATDVDGSEARETITTKPVPIVGQYEVELQQLYVTVTRNGKRALYLEREDFSVLDEGRPQQLVTFEHGDIPFTAVLLIDASASMYGSKMEAARAGASAFIDGMRELDHGKVIVFSDVIQNSTPFSGVREVLTAGLTGATGEGGTALNDHLFAALKLLEGRQGRRVVVVLSDGTDHHSALGMDQVFEHARRSQALIYWIRLERVHVSATGYDARSVSTAWRRPEEYREQIELLIRAVETSGGRIIDAETPAEIRPIFIEILRELREQYALGYYPDNLRNDGRWHKVKVSVGHWELEVRTHQGYVDL